MIELRCSCRQTAVERVSRRADRRARRAVGLGRGRRRRHRRRAARCSASPACRRRARAGSARACSALFADEAAASRGGDAARWRRTGVDGCSVAVDRGRSPTQDWVRLTQSQFAPVEITPAFWIVPTWHEPPAEARAGDPARPGPGLRHRHASDDAHVPALDRRHAARRRGWPRVLDYGCGSGILAIGARAASARADVDAVDIDPAAVEATRGERARQRRRARRPALPRRRRAGRYAAGARQHPGHAAEAAGAAAVRRTSTPAARWCWPASSSARPTSCAPPTRRGSQLDVADEDDGWILLDGARSARSPHGMISAMSLATRCTACGTVFRVVQDQLKVSEGWVRCGRCDEVFNALEGLFDLGRDAPRRLAGRAGRPARWRASRRRRRSGRRCRRRADDADGRRRDDAGDEPQRRRRAGDVDLGELLADPVDAHLFGPRKRSEADAQAGRPAAAARDRVEFSDARFDSDLFADNDTSIPDTELATLAVDRQRRPRRSRARCGPTSCAVPSGTRAGAAPRCAPPSASPACWPRCVLAVQAANHYPRHPRGALAVAASARSPPGARSPTAASRRRAGSTKCWSRAPR